MTVKLSELTDERSGLGLDKSDARMLLNAIKEAEKHTRGFSHSQGGRAVDNTMSLANKMMDQHGVEAIELQGAWVNNYYGNIVGLYVNTGDPYNATLCFDTAEGKFSVCGWGDLLEELEKRQAEEDEPEDDEEDEDEEDEEDED